MFKGELGHFSYPELDSDRVLAKSEPQPDGVFDRPEHATLRETYSDEEISAIQSKIVSPILRNNASLVADLLRRKRDTKS